MIGINLSTDPSNAMAETRAMLLGVKNGYNRAIYNASKRTATHLKTNARKEALKRYAIKSSTFRKNENVEITNAMTAGGAKSEVKFKGNKISLLEFTGAAPKTPKYYDRRHRILIGTDEGPKWGMVRPSKPARAHVLKANSNKAFGNAYTLQMSNGHIGIFTRFNDESLRTEKGSQKIHQIQALSTPEMIGNKEVRPKIESNEREMFVQRLSHETARLLAGYGVK